MKILLQMKMMSMAAAVVLVSLIATGCFSDKKNIPYWLLAFSGGSSDSKTITAFSIPSASATGVISGTNISVTVPYGTDVSALAATFNTTGASVDIGMIIQENGVTPNDFSDPVVYRVTAADSSFQDYTVTVTVASNTAKEITAFSFPSVPATGVVSGTNISVEVPFGADVTELVATFSKTGASVHVAEAVQTSEETPNDFTEPVVYRVTAADNSYQDYTVTVTIASSTAKNITAFSFPSAGVTGTISGLNISVEVPYGTNVTALIATFSTTGMSVHVGEFIGFPQTSEETANDFTEPVVYRVTAANDSYQDYTVTVAIALSPAKNITVFSFPLDGAIGVISGLNISVEVPFGTDVTELVATFSTTGASVKVGSTTQTSEGTPNNFTAPVVYRVTAADDSYQDYTVTVTIAPSPAKEITAFSFPLDGATGVISGLNISVTVPGGTDVAALVATFSTTGASVNVGEAVQISEETSNSFIEPVTYRVTAADSSFQDFIVTVTATAQTCSSLPCIYNAGTSTGDMGGKTGADSICNSSENKPIGTTGYAFMSFDSNNEIRDLPATSGLDPLAALYGPNGQKLANTLADLLDYDLCTDCVTFLAAEVVPGGVLSWNFSGGDGSIWGTHHCSNGTSSSTALDGGASAPSMPYPASWGYSSCDSINYVVCIAQPESANQ